MPTLIVSANTTGDHIGDSTDVADTFLFGHTSGSFQTTNYGGDSQARVTRWDEAYNDRRVQLLYFDLSSLPAGCTINSVSLGLYCISQSGGDTDDIRRLLVEWVESEATWIIRSTGNNWSTAGAQGDGTDRNATIIGVVPNGTGWQVASNSGLVTWVQGVVDGDWSNYGLALQNTGSDWFKENNYHSSEGTDGLRPYLSIDYTEGGGVELAESATATELQTAQKSTIGAMSESVSSEDAQSALKITSGTQIETTTAEDEQAANKSTQSSILETASAVDTISAEVSGESSISESATATDTQGASKTTVSASAETCNALDTVDATKQTVAAIVEAMTALDAVTAESENEGNIAETANALDTVSAILSGLASQIESATAQDTVTAILSTTAAIVENANAFDATSTEDEYPTFNLGAFSFSETQSLGAFEHDTVQALGSFERSEYYDLGEFVCLEES